MPIARTRALNATPNARLLSRMRYFGARSHGNASVIWRASHSAVGFRVTAIHNSRRRPDTPAVIVDAGSAVTVDYVDERGVFRGGAILPGLRLMAQALHDYTALLPVVTIDGEAAMPGATTTEAIKAGVFAAVLGGVERLVFHLVSAGRCVIPGNFVGRDVVRVGTRRRAAPPRGVASH